MAWPRLEKLMSSSTRTHNGHKRESWGKAGCSITHPHSCGQLFFFYSVSSPPHTHTHTLFSFFLHSMYCCSFLCSQPFSRRPVGLLLLLLFPALQLSLHMKQEHDTMMWPRVPWLRCTTQCRACVGWVGQYLPRPPHGCIVPLSPLLHSSGI